MQTEEQKATPPLLRMPEPLLQLGKYRVPMTAVIGGILQGGVILSAIVILIGVFLLPFSPGGLSPERINHFPHTLADVGTGLLTFHPQAIITLGLLILVATPVLRVAVSVVAFEMEHDRKYTIITVIVLAILITSFLLGKGGA